MLCAHQLVIAVQTSFLFLSSPTFIFSVLLYLQDPQNEYLSLHAEPSWNALDLLWNQVPEEHTKVCATIYRSRFRTSHNYIFEVCCAASGQLFRCMGPVDGVGCGRGECAIQTALQTLHVPVCACRDQTKHTLVFVFTKDLGQGQVLFAVKYNQVWPRALTDFRFNRGSKEQTDEMRPYDMDARTLIYSL